MKISRQVRRAKNQKQEKEDQKLSRQLELSDFTYEATDENTTFSAMGPQLVDFIKAELRILKSNGRIIST